MNGQGPAASALTRRRFLTAAGTVAAAGAVTAVAARRAAAADAAAADAAADAAAAAADTAIPAGALGPQPPGLPARQHAWAHFLRRDQFGNAVAPRFDRLLFFDVRGRAAPAHATLLESRLRTLERRFPWGPEGLLFTVSYGPTYFSDVLAVPSPIETATRLSSFESPAIDHHQVCIHMACDDERRLADIEAALVHGRRLRGVAGSLSLRSILVWRETRTGFSGKGLPRAFGHVRGVPGSDPVPADAPLFMGFRSGLRKNQATEDDVTIADGPFAQGTTMHVSQVHLQLEQWYGGMSAAQRVALMYSPQTTVTEAARFTTDASGNPGKVMEAINRYGVIGHAQTSALARRHGRPVIIRRDFDTIDGGRAGLHFVSLQRAIQDFVAVRNAMNAAEAHSINPRITATRNNGINAFMDVRRRANYLMPARAQRAFPLLPGY